MLKDITIGQYFPTESIVHRLDSRFKIIITGIYIAMLFSTDSFKGILIGGLFCAAAFVLSGISFRLMGRSIKPIMPLLIFTAVLNMFFADGEVIWSLGILELTREGVKAAVFMVIRIILLIAGSSLLTYTTSPIEITYAIEKLLSPLKKINFPVDELAMMMTIALRFIPTLIEETDKIMSAQKARGADFETGSLARRAKALVPILIPLFVSAFRRAEELADAMECRCYNGGKGRTRLKQLKIRPADYAALAVALLFFGMVKFVDIC